MHFLLRVGLPLQMQLRRERIEEAQRRACPRAILKGPPARNRFSLLHWLHAPQDDALLLGFPLEIHLRRERTNTWRKDDKERANHDNS
jgi:hypothetical protein